MGMGNRTDVSERGARRLGMEREGKKLEELGQEELLEELRARPEVIRCEVPAG